MGDTLLQRRNVRQAREYYQRAQGIFSDLRSQGKLAADFRNEPERLSSALEKLRRGES
jgi:hypothetical protein